MATSRSLRPWQYRALAILIGVTVVVALVLATATMPARGQATVGGLDIQGVDRTVSGNVSAVTLDAKIDFSHDVPDATSRIVELHVGPSESELDQLSFRRESDPRGDTIGAVEMQGDVTDTSAFSADDFAPPVAGNESQQVVVQAVIEVERPNGQTVTATATDTATVQLTDSATLSADVGGTGNITVATR